jgi:hypothetical protein
VLDLEASDAGMANRVQRASDGRILFVDARTTNFRKIDSKTLDLTIEKRIDHFLGGALHLSAAATRNLSFKVQTSANAPAIEQVRNASANFFFPVRWNGNAQIRWEGKECSMGWTVRYFDSILVNPAYVASQGSNEIDREFEHDARVSWRFRAHEGDTGIGRLLDQTTVSLGVKNVFNRAPRFYAGGILGVYDGDSLYGRSIWIQLRKNF